MTSNAYSITYEWSFPALEVRPNIFNFTDSVCTIHWNLTGTDTLGNSVFSMGTVPIPDPTSASDAFIPYENLTKDIIIEWVTNELDVPAVEQNIVSRINSIINPTQVVLAPPFSQ